MQDHVILNYLDQPLKFFIWPAKTVGAVLGPVGLFILLGKPIWGVAISLIMAFAIREYKRRFGAGSLIGLAYWVLPHRRKEMPMTPPSHIREFIG